MRVVEPNSSALNEQQLQIPENIGRSRLPWLLAGGALLALLIAAGAYFLRPEPVAELYLVQPVTRRDIVQRIEAAGRVDVRHRVEIPAPIEGRLVSVHVRSGDRVEAGQLLAVLDERAASLAVSSARASELAAASGVGEAQTALAAAERTLARVTRLNERGLASDNDVQNAESALSQARAAVQAARAGQRVAGQGVASAQFSKELGQITATQAGVVLRAPERIGAAVSPEAGPLFVLGDPLELMRVDARVGETDIALMSAGQMAEVSVAAIDGKTFEATVEHIGVDPEQELGAVLYPITLTVSNPDRLLLPGMTARVLLEVEQVEQVLAVHEAALRFVPEEAAPATARSRVFRRVAPGQLEAVAVQPGISDGMYTAVEPVEGQTLAEGDALAIGFLRPTEGSRGPSVTLGEKK